MTTDNIKPNWRSPAEIRGYVGDRIIGICQWCDGDDIKAERHVITLTIHDDGVTRDNEEQGYTLEDCECWMPEAEFLRLFATEVT